jgi:hypothetical protein
VHCIVSLCLQRALAAGAACARLNWLYHASTSRGLQCLSERLCMPQQEKSRFTSGSVCLAGMSKAPAPPGPRVRPSIYGDGLKMPQALARIRAVG